MTTASRADYLQGMKDGGFGGLPLDEVINARDHGVTPDLRAKPLARQWLCGGLPLDQLINARDHGVTAAYIKEMKALGHSGSLSELVTARSRRHGRLRAQAR